MVYGPVYDVAARKRRSREDGGGAVLPVPAFTTLPGHGTGVA